MKLTDDGYEDYEELKDMFNKLLAQKMELQAKYDKVLPFIEELHYILEHKPDEPLLLWCLEAEALLKELGELGEDAGKDEK